MGGMDDYFLTWWTRDRLRELRAAAGRRALRAANRPEPVGWRRALGSVLIKLGTRIAASQWRDAWTTSRSSS